VAPAAPETLAITATVAAPLSKTEPDMANNSARDTNALTPTADLAVTVMESPDPVNGRETLTYTFSVDNNGPRSTESVTATLSLPAGASFVSVEGTGWECVEVDGVVTCTRPTAEPGVQPGITVQVTAPNMDGALTA